MHYIRAEPSHYVMWLSHGSAMWQSHVTCYIETYHTIICMPLINSHLGHIWTIICITWRRTIPSYACHLQIATYVISEPSYVLHGGVPYRHMHYVRAEPSYVLHRDVPYHHMYYIETYHTIICMPHIDSHLRHIWTIICITWRRTIRSYGLH